jgi:hypothetical protein
MDSPGLAISSNPGASSGIADSRALNANSDFFPDSVPYRGSELLNTTVGLARTEAPPGSGRFAFSSPLDKSSAFEDSAKLRTEDVGELRLSDSNQSFPVGSALQLLSAFWQSFCWVPAS